MTNIVAIDPGASTGVCQIVDGEVLCYWQGAQRASPTTLAHLLLPVDLLVLERGYVGRMTDSMVTFLETCGWTLRAAETALDPRHVWRATPRAWRGMLPGFPQQDRKKIKRYACRMADAAGHAATTEDAAEAFAMAIAGGRWYYKNGLYRK